MGNSPKSIFFDIIWLKSKILILYKSVWALLRKFHTRKTRRSDPYHPESLIIPKYQKTSTYDLGNGQFQRHYGPHSHTISTGLLSRTKVRGSNRFCWIRECVYYRRRLRRATAAPHNICDWGLLLMQDSGIQPRKSRRDTLENRVELWPFFGKSDANTKATYIKKMCFCQAKIGYFKGLGHPADQVWKQRGKKELFPTKL